MHRKNRFDVLIVGAGPAGATAAFILANNGYKVGIIEKRRFPRFKLCGGLLSQKTIKLLKDIFNMDVNDLEANGVIHFHSHSYAVGDQNGRCLHGKLDFPFYFVNRNLYDLQWLNKATVAGATAFFEESVVAVDFGSGKVSTRTGKQFWGRFILAADGVFSRIRSMLTRHGLLSGRRMQDIAVALEIFIPRETSSDFADHPNIYYGFTPWGYAWSFPGPRDQILGICALKRKLRRPIAICFNDFLKAQGVAAEHFSNAKGFCLPYGNYLHKAGYENFLLIGDAGGFADPFFGEGIYYAHKSAQLACAAIRQSFNKPQNVLKLYSQSLNRSVVTELKYAKMIRRILFSLPRHSYFKLMAFMLKQMPDKLVETVHGRRSFKFLRPLTLT
ncbi:MAG: geranylgeranyl reductase family protein [Desulfobacterales bacterium]